MSDSWNASPKNKPKNQIKMTTNDLLLSFYASAPFDEFERALEATEDAEFIETVEENQEN